MRYLPGELHQLPPSIMRGAGKFGLPAAGERGEAPGDRRDQIATSRKIEHGSGSPVRVIAIMPAAVGAGW